MMEKSTPLDGSASQPENLLDICRLAGNGDPDGQRRLMELLVDRIHKTASYLTGDRDEAKDLAQNACIQVLRSAGTFRGDSSLTYWADRVTLKTAASVFRNKTRRQRITENYFQPPPVVMGVEEHVGRAQVMERLTVLLQRLKPNHREIVLLRHIHGYSIKEAAALCDIPIETARARLKKGRRVMKKKVLADPLLKDWVQEWIER